MSDTIQKLVTIYELKNLALDHAGGDLAKAQAIYAWLIEGTTIVNPPAADTATPKAEKTKAESEAIAAKKPKAETPKREQAQKAEAPPAEKAVDKEVTELLSPLNYDTDVLPKIVATVSRLTTAGADPQTAKGAIVAMMKERFDVSSAKDITADKWADLIAALDGVNV